jgi:hypothetical protein
MLNFSLPLFAVASSAESGSTLPYTIVGHLKAASRAIQQGNHF